MNLESQVASLELSKRLKELGVKQESLWWWCFHTDKKQNFKRLESSPCGFGGNCGNKNAPLGWCCSAFTVAELGEMLPDWIVSLRLDGNRGWVCYDDDKVGNDSELEISDVTEANARAKMLIHLIEAGVVKP